VQVKNKGFRLQQAMFNVHKGEFLKTTPKTTNHIDSTTQKTSKSQLGDELAEIESLIDWEAFRPIVADM
jgi:hypothetical protein